MLCEYPHVSPAAKKRILHNQKFPKCFQVSYYQPALTALLRSLDLATGKFNPDILAAEILRITTKEAKKPRQVARKANNLLAAENIAIMSSSLALPAGQNSRIQQKAILDIEGVDVSVRPEFITQNQQLNGFSLTKFRFSKSPVSADAVETGLILLLEYAKEARFNRSILDFEQTRIVDVFSQTVIQAHTVGRHRLLEVKKSLGEIVNLWPFIKSETDLDIYDGPGG